MKLGIATLACSAVRTAPGIDVFSALALICDAGFACIEYNDQSPPQFFRASNSEMEQVRRKAEELGIEIWSAHSPCGGRYDLTSPDDDTRDEALAVNLRSVELLGSAGVKHLVVHQVDGPPSEWPRRFRRAVEALTTLCEAGERSGVKILIENFPGYGCGELLELLAAVNRPELGICFDVGHAHLDGLSLASEIRLCGKHLSSLHVHDNHGPGSGDEHLPPGWGTANWNEVLEALTEIRYCGPFMLEVTRESKQLSSVSPQEAVSICAQTVRAILPDAAMEQAEDDQG